MRYYIADLHFFHDAMNHEMDRRGFENAEKMNEYMLEKWNNKVRDKDEVVILGDLSWGSAEETNHLLARMKGKLYLIQGNHDRFLKDKKMNTGRFKWIKSYEEMSDNKRKVILCHYPILFYNGQYRLDGEGKPKTYMLYGHVHDSGDQRLMEAFQRQVRETRTRDMQGNERNIPCQMINCFCVYSDYEPLSLDEWIICEERRKNSEKTCWE